MFIQEVVAVIITAVHLRSSVVIACPDNAADNFQPQGTEACMYSCDGLLAHLGRGYAGAHAPAGYDLCAIVDEGAPTPGADWPDQGAAMTVRASWG